MKVKLIAVAAMALLAVGTATADAQCPSNVGGVNIVEVPAGQDVYTSVPYTQPCDGEFTVQTKTGSGVTVTGPLDDDEYAGLYYVRFTDGDAEGRWSTITSNTATELVLEDTSFLDNVSATDTFRVFAHQTLASVFPDGEDDEYNLNFKGYSFEESSSPFIRATEILFPDEDTTDINKAPAETYYYYNGAWRKVGELATVSYDDTIISPDRFFTIRNNGDEDLTFLTYGRVPMVAGQMATQTRDLETASADNDIAAVTGRGIATTLADLDLGGTDAFATSASPFIRADELFVYDNTDTDINGSPKWTYYYYNVHWRRFGEEATEHFDDEVLPAGTALKIRKAGGTPNTDEWSH